MEIKVILLVSGLFLCAAQALQGNDPRDAATEVYSAESRRPSALTKRIFFQSTEEKAWKIFKKKLEPEGIFIYGGIYNGLVKRIYFFLSKIETTDSLIIEIIRQAISFGPENLERALSCLHLLTDFQIPTKELLENFFLPIFRKSPSYIGHALKYLTVALNQRLSVIEARELWLTMIKIRIYEHYKDLIDYSMKSNIGLDNIVTFLLKVYHMDIQYEYVSFKDVINVRAKSINKNIPEEDYLKFIKGSYESFLKKANSGEKDDNAPFDIFYWKESTYISEWLDLSIDENGIIFETLDLPELFKKINVRDFRVAKNFTKSCLDAKLKPKDIAKLLENSKKWWVIYVAVLSEKSAGEEIKKAWTPLETQVPPPYSPRE